MKNNIEEMTTIWLTDKQIAFVNAAFDYYYENGLDKEEWARTLEMTEEEFEAFLEELLEELPI